VQAAVLIVGAGPVGLTLALDRGGVRTLLLEHRSGPSTDTPRAAYPRVTTGFPHENRIPFIALKISRPQRIC
jgi:thioredoxin reductase